MNLLACLADQQALVKVKDQPQEIAMKLSSIAITGTATLFCACFFGGSFSESRLAYAEESNFIFDVGDVTLNVDPENRSGKSVQPRPQKLQQPSTAKPGTDVPVKWKRNLGPVWRHHSPR